MVPAAIPGEAVRRSTQSLYEALSSVQRIAKVVNEGRDFPDAPVEVTVEFGMKLTGSTSIVITSGNAEANQKISGSDGPSKQKPKELFDEYHRKESLGPSRSAQ